MITRLAFLIPLLALWSCGERNQPNPITVSARSDQLLAGFHGSTLAKEADLLKAAALALRLGIPLEAAAAEKCWVAEGPRPRIRETCLLLWAAGEDPSPALEKELVPGSNRMVNLALLARPAAFRGMRFPALLEYLRTLAAEPLWVRARAAALWGERNGGYGPHDAELVAKLLGWQGEELGPRDLAGLMAALKALRPGLWQQALNNYCDSSVRGEARLRCWRAIGAAAGEIRVFREISHWLPYPSDPDWILFTRTFPALVERINHAQKEAI